MRGIQFVNRWLISPRQDLMIFAIIPLLGYWVATHFGGTTTDWGPYVVVLMILLEYSHLSVTFFPLMIRHQKKTMPLSLLWIILAGIPLLSLLIYNMNLPLFRALAVILVGQHIIRQMYGWLTVSQRDKGRSLLKTHDIALFYSLTLLPFLFNFSALSTHPDPFFFRPGDSNFLRLNEDFARGLLVLFFASIGYFTIAEIRTIWRTRQVLLTKYFIFLSAGFCFSYCYFLAPVALYWLPHSLHHGYSYLVFNYRHIKKNLPRNFFSNPVTYLLLISLLGVMHFSFGKINFNGSSWAQIFWPLLWSVAFIHYFSDIFIWRRAYMKGVKL